MVQSIIWTPEATFTYEKVISYILENFSEREVIKFSYVVQKKINLIQINPNTYRKSAKFANVHYTIILTRVLLVYRYHPKKKIIEILQFWDARQNPKRFRF
jgi:plasmid stabilization system protein ParE